MPIRFLMALMWSLFGCNSAQKQVAMVGTAHVESEPHIIWTRPLELGFETRAAAARAAAAGRGIATRHESMMGVRILEFAGVCFGAKSFSWYKMVTRASSKQIGKRLPPSKYAHI